MEAQSTRMQLSRQARALARTTLDALLLEPIERFERRVLCRRYMLQGWEIGISRHLADQPAMLDILGQALSLVDSQGPIFGKWTRSHISRFLILDVNYASHRRGSLTCVVSASVLRKGDVAVVASKIVHEATHGRFTSFRYVARKPEFVRMENRCIHEQAGFLRGLHRHGWINAEEWARFFERELRPAADGS